jgi:uncharacterized protein with PQ loop repeat
MNAYVTALGWTATLVGLYRMYPQARMIARSKSINGVSPWSITLTILSMAWWLIYCAAIADVPSTVSSVGSALAPAACLILLLRRRACTTRHLVFIVAGTVVGAAALFAGTDVIGLLAAASTMAYTIPQFHRLVRTGDVAGLSEASWALTAINTALWTLYGWYIQSVPLMLPALVTIPVALLVAHTMERRGDTRENDGVLIGPRRRSFRTTPR